MDQNRKKELKEEYQNRKPKMGLVAWTNGTDLWVDLAQDVKAYYNSSSFQLKLGSWPNFELQEAFTKNPMSFTFSCLTELEYQEDETDYTEDLEVLLEEYLKENPKAKKGKNRKRRK